MNQKLIIYLLPDAFTASGSQVLLIINENLWEAALVLFASIGGNLNTAEGATISSFMVEGYTWRKKHVVECKFSGN